MNAVPLTTITAGRRFGRTRKLLSEQFGKISQTLGLDGAVGLPEKPMIRHELEQLTLSNHTICETRNGWLSEEYLGLPEIEVVAKLSLRQLVNGQCEYRFRLNAAPDSIWRCFFKRRVPNLSVRFEGNVMVLTCHHSNLEWDYHKVKEALLQANLWYGEEWEDLLEQVAAKDAERRLVRELEENRKNGLRRQFEGLQI